MAINKIVLNTENGEQVLVDLTGDSVTPETLAEGVTAHDKSGKAIVGTMTAGGNGSGGEDVTAETTAYTEKLEALETAITALEAELEGKASGGGNVEAWTGTISAMHIGMEFTVHYTDETLTHRTATVIGWTQDATITIAAGTLIYVGGVVVGIGSIGGSNVEFLIEDPYSLILPTANDFYIDIA